ncbi:MAG: Antibiotic efflux protein [uncultured Thermomicrobiales bacterium]|uniref:Antibiotic efflux protein n=1 Tax=uncultured Thermomicrobiales bacterium TaxID=1645740 RepID=A0A6J4USC6_9BACT|nr:MAG: Antibiotic efflux protein [uncultured Thermomicrobiales bacterium]
MIAQPTQTPSPRLVGEFRKLWVSSAVSNLGDGVALVAAPLLAATLTDDPALIAGLALVQRLPWLLFALASGALADRLDRRRAMVVVAACRAVLIGVLGVAALLDQASLPLLYAVFFLLSTGETLFDTAAATILPAIVPREVLPRANAQLSATLTVANQFVGPPLGGFLFAAALALPFLLGAGGLATAAAILLTLRGTFRVAREVGRPATALRAEIAEGVRWLWRHRLLRTLALTLAVLNVPLVAQVSIMVLFARERLGFGPEGFGLLLTTYGLGGTLGGLVAGRVIDRLGASRTLRLALLIEIATPAALALARDPFLAGATLALFGCHATVWGALLSSLRQELTPDRLRGRVESVYRLIEYGGAAPGAILGGLLAARLGLAAPFWLGVAAGIILLPFVWGAFSARAVGEAREGDG